MANRSELIWCGDIGSTPTAAPCCTLQEQSECSEIFGQGGLSNQSFLTEHCPSGNCIQDCQNPALLYNAFTTNPDDASVADDAMTRYWACVSVPIIAQLDQKGLLTADNSKYVRQFVPANSSLETIQNVTATVTQCLTDTCNSARHPQLCANACSSVKLLTNSTTPNIDGISNCLYTLCSHGYESVPFANPDIMGIGVFVSYFMQCVLIALITVGFALLGFRSRRHVSDKPNPSRLKHKEALISALVEFHKAQCYYSIALQIASLAYGVFHTSILANVLLLPLATNGVLPVVLAFTLIIRYGRTSRYITLLTFATWLLSSLVFWALYEKMIPVDITDSGVLYGLYQQFIFNLSTNPSCGGSSALATCPENLVAGQDLVYPAIKEMRIFPPIIWTWSTTCFIVTTAWHYLPKHREKVLEISAMRHNLLQWRGGILGGIQARDGVFWITMLGFLVGLGFQLSILFVENSTNMMDKTAWSFGQIVAVTIWLPPIVDYMISSVQGMTEGSKYRFARTLIVARVDSSSSTSEMLPLNRSAHSAQEPSGKITGREKSQGRGSHSYQQVPANNPEIE